MSEPTAANDWKRPGVTPSTLIRRSILALVALISLAALAVAALPMVASTQLVRNRIAIELSAWSGFRVAIASTPQLELWPFKAVLSGVTLYQWGDWDNPAVIEAERVEINLSALDALNGNVSFTEARLVNPVIRVGLQIGEPGPEIVTSGGKISQAIEAYRAQLGDDPDRPETSRMPATPFGAVDIQNGRVVVMDGNDQRDVVTRLGGRVDWPALNAAGNASLSGVWRGEQVKVDMSSESPLTLLAGGATRVAVRWESGPITGALNGNVRRAADGRVDAHLEVNVPSARRAISWTGINLATGGDLEQFRVSTDIVGNRNRVTTRDVQVTISNRASSGVDEGGGSNSVGSGALSIEPFATRPKLAGVLTFEELDIGPFLSLFTPLTLADQPRSPEARSLADLIDADVKVTAARARFETLGLTGVAATVDIDQQTAAFLLDSATGFGGALKGALRFEEKLNVKTTGVSLSAAGIDAQPFAEVLGMTQFTPVAKGDIDFKVVGKGSAVDTVMAYANGEVTAKLGAGELRGIDVGTLVAKAVGGGFFPLADVGEGVLPIATAELEAKIENGVARISKGLISAGPKTISLTGIMPYAGRGVALSGLVLSTDKISLLNPFGREAAFFVGGSWDAPFVSAAVPPRIPQQ